MHVDSVRVGLFQGPLTTPDTFASVEFNLAAIDTAAREAAASGAKILLTPEMSATGYDIGELVSLRAEPADGPIFDSVAEIARSAGIAVVYGYPELDGGDVYNSVQVVDRDGTSLAHYRKTQIPSPRLLEVQASPSSTATPNSTGETSTTACRWWTAMALRLRTTARRICSARSTVSTFGQVRPWWSGSISRVSAADC